MICYFSGILQTLVVSPPYAYRISFLTLPVASLFGTHTLYQEGGGGGGGSTGPPAISKTVSPMNVKFCRILETSLNVLEM